MLFQKMIMKKNEESKGGLGGCQGLDVECPPRLVYLNGYPPVGGTTWGGCETFGKWNFVGEMGHWWSRL